MPHAPRTLSTYRSSFGSGFGLLLLSSLTLAGCGAAEETTATAHGSESGGTASSEGPGSESSTTGAVMAEADGSTVDGCFVTADAPAPLACEADTDCTSGGLFRQDRCCMSGVTHTHSRAYHAWQVAYFREHCDENCIEPPARPEDCMVDVRCEAGRCVNSCE